MIFVHPTIQLTYRKCLGKLIPAVREGQGAPTLIAGHLPFPPDVLLIFSLTSLLLWERNITVNHITHSCILHGTEESLHFGFLKRYHRANSHWRHWFYSVNELLVLSNWAQWASGNYCILQCFSNCQLAPWDRGTCILYWYANNTLDVMASIYFYYFLIIITKKH